MYEYAMLRNGYVINISTRRVPIDSAELVRYASDATGYCPIWAVPMHVLSRYEYWSERP